MPKISLWKKKFFYDFKTGNYNLFSKIGNGQVVENIFPEKISYDLKNFNHFQKIGKER